MASSAVQFQSEGNLWLGRGNACPFQGCLKEIVTNGRSDDGGSGCWRRQRSHVIDRWVGSQASQIFMGTEERKSYEAEISVIFDSVEPVSSRTAAFIKQDTPPSSGSPVSWTLSDRSVLEDLPSSARASSLIQLWREIEADGENSVSNKQRNSSSDKGAFEEEKSSRESPNLGSDLGVRKELVEDVIPLEAVDSGSSGPLERMRKERQEELDLLLKEHCVSSFSNRSGIQAMLRFQHSDRLYTIAKKQFQNSTNKEIDCVRRKGSKVCSLRDNFIPGNKQLAHSVKVMPRKMSNFSPSVMSADATNELSISGKEVRVTGARSDKQSILQDCFLTISRCERMLDRSNCNDQADDLKSNIQSPLSLCSHKSFPETDEIQELLQRKPVSCSLGGEFRKTIENLVLSLLKKQQSTFKDSCDDNELLSADDSSSASFFDSPKVYEESCISSPPSHHFLEVEVVHDLRKDIAGIHYEIADVRKLLNHCIDGHSKLQDLVRDRLPSVCFNTALHATGWTPAKGAPCSICHETLSDSLLYRCGHLCACYSCALDLRLKNGLCPVCASPIDDVVKVLAETNNS
ncbi:uncharacterized protein LOC144704429 isoform X2 [Wolffia australiana]